MAINGNNNRQTNQQQKSQQAEAQFTSTDPRGATAPNPGRGNPFTQSLNPFGTNVVSSMDLTNFVEFGKKHLEENRVKFSHGGVYRWSLVMISGAALSVRLDSVALVQTLTVQDAGTISNESYATLIFAPGETQLPQQTPVVGNKRYKYSAVASDMLDIPGYAEEVYNSISTQVPEAGNISLIGSLTVPPAYTMTEASAVQLLVQLMGSSYGAIQTYVSDAEPFTLTPELTNEFKLRITGDLHPADTFDMLNNPIRSDIRLNVEVQSRDTREDTIVNSLSNSGNRPIGQIQAYVDPIYVNRYQKKGRLSRNGFIRGKNNDNDELMTRVYNLGLHITKIETGDFMNLPMLLLTLAQSAHLVRESVGFKMLKPTQEVLSIRNHNTWKYDTEKPDLVDEMNANPSNQEWEEYTDAFFHEDAIDIFLHVDQSGPMAPLMEIIVTACSNEDPDEQSVALDLIHKAAADLTNGQFVLPRETNGYGWVGTTDRLQFVGGYYTDTKTNQRKDVRELLNQFAATTFYGQQCFQSSDYNDLEDFKDILYNGARTDVERLQAQETFLNEMSGGTARITTRHKVIKMNPEFILNLIDAIAATRLYIDSTVLEEEQQRRVSYHSPYAHQTFNGFGYRR